MLLSSVLQEWAENLGYGNDRIWRKRARLAVYGCKLSIAVSWIVFALCLCDGIASGPSVIVGKHLRYLAGLTAGNFAQAFFASKRKAIIYQLKLLEEISQEMHLLGLQKRPMQRIAHRQHVLMKSGQIYSSTVVIFVFLTAIIFDRPILPAPIPMDPLQRVVLYVLQTIAVVCAPFSMFTLIPLMLCTTSSSACLHRALGCLVQNRHGYVHVLNAIKKHQKLCNVDISLDRLYRNIILPFLGGLLITAMAATYEVIEARNLDLISVVSLPLVVLVMVPLCFVGQDLENSSSMMCWFAYCGSWQEEDWYCRRLRLMIMVRSKRSSILSVRGIGKVDLPACQSVIKTWFSFLQALLNL